MPDGTGSYLGERPAVNNGRAAMRACQAKGLGSRLRHGRLWALSLALGPVRLTAGRVRWPTLCDVRRDAHPAVRHPTPPHPDGVRAQTVDLRHPSARCSRRRPPPFGVPDLFGKLLATPVGPSAGPHTQLSQNIVSSWLCGGRFIELKTVQAERRAGSPRPCIDMTDEGYNVEWSQELTLEQSAHEYVVAWALVHVLPRILGWDARGQLPGAIFDMSVGYDLAGIRQSAHDAVHGRAWPTPPSRSPRSARRSRRDFPAFADVEIPTRHRQQRHPLHHARLPARRDRADRALPASRSAACTRW